ARAAPTFSAGVVQSATGDELALSRGLLGESPVDVLVCPESVPTNGVPLIFRAALRERDLEYDAAFFQGAGRTQTYRKSRLVPLVEHVPGWLDFAALRRALPWSGHVTSGPGPRTVSFALAGGTPVIAVPLLGGEALDAPYVLEAAAGA